MTAATCIGAAIAQAYARALTITKGYALEIPGRRFRILQWGTFDSTGRLKDDLVVNARGIPEATDGNLGNAF